VIDFSCDPPRVGEEAKASQGLGEEKIASFFKRSMGDPNFVLHLGGQVRTPIDLSALVLKKLKGDAEAKLGTPVTQAVITVPAYFNNAQREATIEAGRLAGLEVLRIINEPTAAALAFGLRETKTEQRVLVYDLGGGTFDVSLVEITPVNISVLATDGDHNLGGKDWDDRIVVYLGQHFADAHGVNPLDNNVSFNDLLVRAEDAKKALSSRNSTRVAIHYEGQRETYELTREKFQELTQDLMERTQCLAEQVMTESGVTWTNLTGVLLVGGSTRMPMVHDYVRRMSGKEPMMGVNVDEAVAMGAAIQAAIDLREKSGGKHETFFLGGSRRIQDVMSHSLGMIAVSQDGSKYVNSIIIPKNQQIPCTIQRPYQLRTRRGDNELEIYITQGEIEDPRSCSFLGKHRLTGIHHSSSGPTVLDISYAYDQNGVVQVSALDHASGIHLPIRVESLPSDMSWLSRPPQASLAQEHLTVYMAFDLSGSMAGGPLQQAQKAANAFVDQMDLAHTSVGVIAFADSVSISINASQNAKQLRKAIGSLSIGMVGFGNATDPFREALDLLQKVSGARFLIVLTDGVWSHQEAAVKRAKACHQKEIEVVAIGFGGADKKFLRRIATSEEASLLTAVDKLVSTFSTIAKELTQRGSGAASGSSRMKWFG